MRQHQLQPPPGSKKDRKRVGRGDGSQGTTSGKGTKGQKARTGGGVRPGFEGGQLPIIKRLPSMRGFKNIFRIEYAEINVGQLEKFEAGAEVTAEVLAQAGMVRNARMPLKVLGDGEISKKLTVKADEFSAAAITKIQAAGGQIERVL